MKRVGGKHWKLTSTLLLVLLIAAQTGALAHADEHDPGTLQDTTCASCVSAGELTSACLDSGVAADIKAFHSGLETDQRIPIESIATLSARQRGPPDYS
jgi:hypothetical protein